jgi:hypothetical protein
MAAEDVVLNYVRGESITPEGLGEARKECAALIAELAKRLRGE